MRPNYIGIVGVAIIFISLLLPWWTMAISWTSNIGKTQISGSQSIDVYPYKSGFNTGLVTLPVALNLQGTFVILLLVMGSLLGILGSLVGRGGSVALAIGGLLSLLSAIVFGVNMILELSRPEVLAAEVPRVALFSTGTLSGAYTRSYYAYLSFGFWLVVAGGIILFAATRKNRDRSIPDLEQQKNVQTTNPARAIALSVTLFNPKSNLNVRQQERFSSFWGTI